MKIGVPTEIAANEDRVALIPADVGRLVKAGHEVLIQSNAGHGAHFLDSAYEAVGAKIVPDAATLYGSSDIVVKVQRPVVDAASGVDEVALMKPGTLLIAFFSPLVNHDLVRHLAARNITSFSMDMIPRTTRAQFMDALSSQATIAGYKAVLIAADTLGRMFPLLNTAAGTIVPARVFVLGAGVAGLQAIATARRLGAVVEAFDVRPVVKEQVESLGAKFVQIEGGQIEGSGQGGYAKELSEEQHRLEEQLLAKHAKDSDVIITTAQIPGRPAPRLISAEMVKTMKPGSVIVDLAAESGGNCELSKAGEVVVVNDVTILGPINIPGSIPVHASQMYSKNISNLLALLVPKTELNLNMEDEIIAGTIVTQGGQVVNSRVRALVEPAAQGAAA